MAEKGGPAIDQDLLDVGRRNIRREMPHEIDEKLLALLFKRGKEKRKTFEVNAIIEPFNKSEKESLYEIEKNVLSFIVEEDLFEATERIGGNSESIVPYRENPTVEAAIFEVKSLINVVKTSVSGQPTERQRIVLSELGSMRKFLEGNAALLKASGPMLSAFFDGWAAMANGVRAQPRWDMTADQFYLLYSAVKEESPDWELGKELIGKQDRAYSIMRGISAAHRSESRNMGQPIDDGYLISVPQKEFVERVFGSNPSNEKGEEQGDILVGEKLPKHKLENEIIDLFVDGKKSAETFLRDQDGKIKLVIGKSTTITEDLLSDLSHGRYKFMWVSGTQWPINKDTIAELKWKVGSGDEVFIENSWLDEVTRDNYQDILRSIGTNDVYLIRQRKRAIDNLFVVSQSPEKLIDIKRKIAVLMASDTWELLEKSDADLEDLLLKFNADLTNYKEVKGEFDLDPIDRHIIDTARIGLLFFLEGAKLGWGFDYEEAKVGSNTRVYKRGVSSGGTKANTDIATPFFWLQTEAGNNWKYWTHNALPMDEHTIRQIREHEPGWAPWINKEKGQWKVSFIANGKRFELQTDVPVKFDMSLFETATFTNPSEELRIKVGDDYQSKVVMDLLKEGKKMSDVPWRKLIGEAQYRWYITLSQLSISIVLLSRLPTRDLMSKFFVGNVSTLTPSGLLEYMKRVDLGVRDLRNGTEILKKLLPFTAALWMGWYHNLFRNSPKPGIFSPSDVRESVSDAKIALEEIKPKGKANFGKEMANNLGGYMNTFIKGGVELNKEMSRRDLFRSR